MAALIAVAAIVGAVVMERADGEERPPEVTFSGALQAIEEGKVSQVHMNDGTREALLVLATGAEVVTVYPERSGPQLVEAARESDVKLTASRRSRDPWWIRYAYLPASLGVGLLYLAIVVVMDRRGVWHEKDTWMPGARARRLEESVDRLEAALDRIERRLDVPPGS